MQQNFFGQNSRPQQQYVTEMKQQGLKEMSISPKDLIELDAQTYNEIKSQGRNIQEIKSSMHKPKDQEHLNFNVAFVPPKKQNFQRTPVFLPEKNQRYDMNTLNEGIKSMAKPQGQTTYQTYQTKPQQTYVSQQQTYVSTPQTYVQSTPHVNTYQTYTSQNYQPTTTYVQSYPQKVSTQSYNQPQGHVTYETREVRKSNGYTTYTNYKH